MITKDQLLASMRRETDILKHLATKVPDGQLDWRPTPKQRSTLELLQYLTTAAIVPVLAMVHSTWQHAEALEAASARIGTDDFAAAMDQQMQAIEDVVSPLSERDLLERDATLPWGEKTKLGIALVDTGLKTLVAYRMQLFLYCKQSGATQLGPSNCWIGRDPPPPAPTPPGATA